MTFATKPRTVKPARPRAAFGLGIEPGTRIIRTWTTHGLTCDLVFDSAARERDPGALPYCLYLRGVGLVASECFASVHGVDVYVRGVVERLEFEARMAVELSREDAETRRAAKRRPRTASPTPSDRQWWAAETEAEFVLPLSGGAPVGEPEPVCGLSGAWFLPGELDDREPLDLPDPEPVAVDRDADGRRGAWGGHGVEEM